MRVDKNTILLDMRCFYRIECSESNDFAFIGLSSSTEHIQLMNKDKKKIVELYAAICKAKMSDTVVGYRLDENGGAEKT